MELGERTPSIESIVQEADAPRWAIELGDGLVVLAEFDQERSRLGLETDLGRPPEEHRLATCEALMMLTSLEHASHDWAMALSEPDGEFQFCGHIAMPLAYPVDLQATLSAFVDQAQQWREIVARGAQPGTKQIQELSPDLLL
ncbi:Tir chaperone protein (CesT) [Variovorax sp. PBL-H6]|nr:Tir chaperone protein (CesT) [Variovorax sp. PBL-H6]